MWYCVVKGEVYRIRSMRRLSFSSPLE